MNLKGRNPAFFDNRKEIDMRLTIANKQVASLQKWLMLALLLVCGGALTLFSSSALADGKRTAPPTKVVRTPPKVVPAPKPAMPPTKTVAAPPAKAVPDCRFEKSGPDRTTPVYGQLVSNQSLFLASNACRPTDLFAAGVTVQVPTQVLEDSSYVQVCD